MQQPESPVRQAVVISSIVSPEVVRLLPESPVSEPLSVQPVQQPQSPVRQAVVISSIVSPEVFRLLPESPESEPFLLNNNNLSKFLVPSVVSPLKPLISSDVGQVVPEPENPLHLLFHQHFVALNASIGSVNSELFDNATTTTIDSYF